MAGGDSNPTAMMNNPETTKSPKKVNATTPGVVKGGTIPYKKPNKKKGRIDKYNIETLAKLLFLPFEVVLVFVGKIILALKTAFNQDQGVPPKKEPTEIVFKKEDEIQKPRKQKRQKQGGKPIKKPAAKQQLPRKDANISKPEVKAAQAVEEDIGNEDEWAPVMTKAEKRAERVAIVEKQQEEIKIANAKAAEEHAKRVEQAAIQARKKKAEEDAARARALQKAAEEAEVEAARAALAAARASQETDQDTESEGACDSNDSDELDEGADSDSEEDESSSPSAPGTEDGLDGTGDSEDSENDEEAGGEDGSENGSKEESEKGSDEESEEESKEASSATISDISPGWKPKDGKLWSEEDEE